ncbi:MAG TPA: alpha-amylase, partial [Candidatus Bathyarchaeia archaeon]|nr:alpha-amylase [Candidatus Bathyarchaeia archaeon]
MTDIVLVFEVHQPHRIRKDFFWENKIFHHLKKEEFCEYYFDNAENKEIFDRASKKCYFPSNSILLDTIDRFKNEKKKVKVSFSLSGVFLEQC